MSSTTATPTRAAQSRRSARMSRQPTSRMLRVAAIAWIASVGLSTGTRSTKTTPWAKLAARASATNCANLIFPAPGGPTSDTTRISPCRSRLTRFFAFSVAADDRGWRRRRKRPCADSPFTSQAYQCGHSSSTLTRGAPTVVPRSACGRSRQAASSRSRPEAASARLESPPHRAWCSARRGGARDSAPDDGSSSSRPPPGAG